MPESQLSHIALKIDGSNVAPDLMTKLLEVTVENDIDQPAMAVIRFDDHELTLANASTFEIGKSVQIDAHGGFTGQSPQEMQTIFKGEIVGIEPDFAAQHEATIVIRAFDKLHRMLRGRQRKSYQNVKDSDIVQQIASRNGLSHDVDATNGTRDWVYQSNVSDFEFVKKLAQRNGYRVSFADDKLKFKRPERGQSKQVGWGDQLQSFRARVSSAHQVKKVEVRGWDPAAKQSIISEVSTPAGLPSLGMNTHGGEVAASAFGEQKLVLVDHSVESATAAQHLAQSVLDQIAGGFVEADGLLFGMPSLNAGESIELNNIGSKFNGKYDVSKVTHFYSAAEGLTTSFNVSGKRTDSLFSAMGLSEIGSGAHLGGSLGIGIVTDIDDPEARGRIKVRLPWLSDEDQSWWARLVSPMAGADRGFMFVPEVDDEVLVGFEHGDIQRPLILGALWNGVDAPPANDAVQSGKSQKRMIRTRENHIFTFDDSDDKKSIELKSSKGHYVKIDDVNDTIKISDMNGNYALFEATLGNISFKCTGDFKIDCGKNFDLKVGVNYTENITANMDSTVTGNYSQTVTGQSSITIASTSSISVGATMSTTAAGTYTVTASMITLN